MHKCIPYAKFVVLRFIEPRWFMNLSERINPFPTHTLVYIPLGEPVKHRFIRFLNKSRSKNKNPNSFPGKKFGFILMVDDNGLEPLTLRTSSACSTS